ncbi:hypothetical protein EDC01DRAFT_678511 [Geopyxis carbonaria]|nr:hypothetical protein EDC01DRAFT_678511 [Geopyxis carbonaria]
MSAESLPDNVVVGSMRSESLPDTVVVGSMRSESLPDTVVVGSMRSESLPDTVVVGSMRSESLPATEDSMRSRYSLPPAVPGDSMRSVPSVPGASPVGPDLSDEVPQKTDPRNSRQTILFSGDPDAPSRPDLSLHETRSTLPDDQPTETDAEYFARRPLRDQRGDYVYAVVGEDVPNEQQKFVNLAEDIYDFRTYTQWDIIRVTRNVEANQQQLNVLLHNFTSEARAHDEVRVKEFNEMREKQEDFGKKQEDFGQGLAEVRGGLARLEKMLSSLIDESRAQNRSRSPRTAEVNVGAPGRRR